MNLYMVVGRHVEAAGFHYFNVMTVKFHQTESGSYPFPDLKVLKCTQTVRVHR